MKNEPWWLKRTKHQRIHDEVEEQIEARVRATLVEPIEVPLRDGYIYVVSVDQVEVDVDIDLKQV